MLFQDGRKIFLLLTLVAIATAKIKSDAPWTKSAASPKVYTRSLGPPSSAGLNTITVPYSPKSPMFPKFVDPKAMIDKKVDFLSNMFGQTSDDISFTNVPPVTQKRSLFSPFSPLSPFSPFSPFSPYYALGFNPGAPMIPGNPMIPNYYPSTYGSGSYSSDTTSRRKRSIVNSEPKSVGPPPPYPTLSPISEEPEDSKLPRSPTMPMMPEKTPLQYLPPYGPMFGPMMDPSMFMAKKTMFLDNLFKTLATSTPAPETTDDTPTTKATIVPPNFWLPSSITPDPMEYNNKVVDFLDKLFTSLKINKTTPTDDTVKYNFVRSLDLDTKTQKKVTRSLDDITAISAAKDAIADSILSELSDLKGDMITTLDDLVNFQKVQSPGASSKKAFKAGPWSKFGAPDPSLPFKQRMAMIGQVFDMLTELQRNITTAVQTAVNAKLDTMKPAYEITPPGTNINMTLLDAIKNRLSTFGPYKSNSEDSYTPKFSRMVPQTATSFWVAYPEDGPAVAVKRQIEEDLSSKLYNEMSADQKKNEIKEQRPRAVNMEMHQGYQSMPPGTVESVQAGGGSSLGHEGGGINLLIQMPALRSRAQPSDNDSDNYWEEYSARDQGRRHHHNHH